MTENEHPYADILHLAHHRSKNRPQMSMHERAAQFSPFAALSGFDEIIAETGRLTDRRTSLSEGEQALLDRKIGFILSAIREGRRPSIEVLFFVPDSLKDGGAYQSHTGTVRRIDPIEKTLVFLAENGRSDGKIIPMADIVQIHGDWAEDCDTT